MDDFLKLTQIDRYAENDWKQQENCVIDSFSVLMQNVSWLQINLHPVWEAAALVVWLDQHSEL